MATKRRSTAMVRDPKQQIEYLEGYLRDKDEVIRRVCSGFFSSQRLRFLTVSICRRNPSLLECEPFSFVNAALDAGFFGIEPNPALAEGYIVPYRNNKRNILEAQFIPGYRGKRNLVVNCGYAIDLEAIPVYDGDQFAVERHKMWGDSPPFTHIEHPSIERGELTAVYTVTTMVSGHRHFQWLPKKGRGSVEFYRQKSRAANAGPWIDSYDAMALKTVVHRTCEQLPRKPGSLLAAVIKAENTYEEGEPMHAYEFHEESGMVTPQLAEEVTDRTPPKAEPEPEPPPADDESGQRGLF